MLNQKGAVIWLTGIPESGKSTIAFSLAKHLTNLGKLCYVIDSEIVRNGLNKDLGFSSDDRKENVRRIGYVASMFVDAGLIVIVAAISPYRTSRQFARSLICNDSFFEVFIDTPLSECEIRDTKGLYRKAKLGLIRNLTGVDAPYEKPDSPELRLQTTKISIEQAVEQIASLLKYHYQ